MSTDGDTRAHDRDGTGLGDVAPGDAYGQQSFTDARAEADQITALAEGIGRWYREGAPRLAGARVTDVSVPGGGASSDLFLADVGNGAGSPRVAVRLEPTYAVYPVVDLEHQFALTRWAADHSDAPVPRPLWYEADPAWLGRPFVVTEAAPGDVGGDVLGGWPAALTDDERRTVWTRSLDALAALHATAVPPAGAHVLPAPGDTALERAVAYWQRYLDFVSQRDEFPLLERAVARLHDEQPADVLPDALVWGDARLGNMLFVDGRPSALLDFEFCHVGLREFDVAFFSRFDHILAVHFMQASRLGGYLGHEESFDYYEAVSGTPIRHREYFTLMASTYSALAVTRVLQGRAAAGYVDGSFVHHHGPMAALAELLGARLDDA